MHVGLQCVHYCSLADKIYLDSSMRANIRAGKNIFGRMTSKALLGVAPPGDSARPVAAASGLCLTVSNALIGSYDSCLMQSL